jgi:hypothetical protein
MGKNLAHKLITTHLMEGRMEVGAEIGLTIDQTLTQDATGTLVMLELEAMQLPRDLQPLGAEAPTLGHAGSCGRPSLILSIAGCAPVGDQLPSREVAHGRHPSGRPDIMPGAVAVGSAPPWPCGVRPCPAQPARARLGTTPTRANPGAARREPRVPAWFQGVFPQGVDPARDAGGQAQRSGAVVRGPSPPPDGGHLGPGAWAAALGSAPGWRRRPAWPGRASPGARAAGRSAPPPPTRQCSPRRQSAVSRSPQAPRPQVLDPPIDALPRPGWPGAAGPSRAVGRTRPRPVPAGCRPVAACFGAMVRRPSAPVRGRHPTRSGGGWLPRAVRRPAFAAGAVRSPRRHEPALALGCREESRPPRAGHGPPRPAALGEVAARRRARGPVAADPCTAAAPAPARTSPPRSSALGVTTLPSRLHGGSPRGQRVRAERAGGAPSGLLACTAGWRARDDSRRPGRTATGVRGSPGLVGSDT